VPIVEFPGERIWVRAADGPEPALVFVHGAGGSSLSWIIQYRQLKGRNRIVQLDLPRHGRSGGQGRGHLVEYAEVVLGLLDALAIERAVLLGHSMGGGVIIELALRHPERVAGLVLTATGAKLGVSPLILQQIDEAPETLPALMGDWICAPGAPEEIVQRSVTMLSETAPEVLGGDFRACNILDLRPRLAEIAAPCLVVCGVEDKLTPPRYSEYLAEQIADAELLLIEKAGHMVMVEQPEAFRAGVLSFLARIGSPA